MQPYEGGWTGAEPPDHVAPIIIPLLPLLLRSVIVEPWPSLISQYPTKPSSLPDNSYNILNCISDSDKLVFQKLTLLIDPRKYSVLDHGEWPKDKSSDPLPVIVLLKLPSISITPSM